MAGAFLSVSCMDSAPQTLRVETGAYDEAADLPRARGARWQCRGSGATYSRPMKNGRRDTVTPDDSGDLSRGREAPMVITPRALVRLARQLAGGARGSFVRRAATRGRGKRAGS